MALLVISFIAGILTVLAPCVLPLLPVIVGGSLAGGSPPPPGGHEHQPLSPHPPPLPPSSSFPSPPPCGSPLFFFRGGRWFAHTGGPAFFAFMVWGSPGRR